MKDKGEEWSDCIEVKTLLRWEKVNKLKKNPSIRMGTGLTGFGDYPYPSTMLRPVSVRVDRLLCRHFVKEQVVFSVYSSLLLVRKG